VSHSLTQELGTIDHKAMSTRYVHDVTMLRRTERGDDGGQQHQQMRNALGSWAVAATSIESLKGIQVHLARPQLLIAQMDLDDARLARRQGSAPQQGAKRRPLREPGELVLQHCGNEAAVRDGTDADARFTGAEHLVTDPLGLEPRQLLDQEIFPFARAAA
jgi:hypothetical protein